MVVLTIPLPTLIQSLFEVLVQLERGDSSAVDHLGLKQIGGPCDPSGVKNGETQTKKKAVQVHMKRRSGCMWLLTNSSDPVMQLAVLTHPKC